MEIEEKDREAFELLYMFKGYTNGSISKDAFMEYIDNHKSDSNTDTTGMSREEIISEIIDRVEQIKKNLHDKYVKGGEDHGRSERS